MPHPTSSTMMNSSSLPLSPDAAAIPDDDIEPSIGDTVKSGDERHLRCSSGECMEESIDRWKSEDCVWRSEEVERWP